MLPCDIYKVILIVILHALLSSCEVENLIEEAAQREHVLSTNHSVNLNDDKLHIYSEHIYTIDGQENTYIGEVKAYANSMPLLLSTPAESFLRIYVDGYSAQFFQNNTKQRKDYNFDIQLPSINSLETFTNVEIELSSDAITSTQKYTINIVRPVIHSDFLFGYYLMDTDGDKVAIGNPLGKSPQPNSNEILDTTLQSRIKRSDDIRSGSVQVFDIKENNTLTNEVLIFPPNPSDADSFGHKVKILEDLLIISSPNEDSNESGLIRVNNTVTKKPLNGENLDSGCVYVYQKNELSWDLIYYIKPKVPKRFAKFGYDLGLVKRSESEFTLAVSASGYYASTDQADHSWESEVKGWVETFSIKKEKNNIQIKPVEIIHPPSTVSTSDCYGCSIELSEDVLLVSAPSDDSPYSHGNFFSSALANIGAVYIYRSQDNLYQTTPYYLRGDAHSDDNATENSYFGFSTSIDEDNIYISSLSGDYPSMNVVDMFKYNPTNQRWIFTKTFKAPSFTDKPVTSYQIHAKNGYLLVSMANPLRDHEVSQIQSESQLAVDLGITYLLHMNEVLNVVEFTQYTRLPNYPIYGKKTNENHVLNSNSTVFRATGFLHEIEGL